MMKYIVLFAIGITILTVILLWVLAPLGLVDDSHINGENGYENGNGTMKNGKYIPDEHLKCNSDDDCFAGECCHSRYCVNAVGKPDCGDDFCTMECRPDTLDCGFASCVCVEGKCAININE